MGVKVLVIGSGGREHALAWKLAKSSKIKELYVAPGNGGTAKIAQNIPIHSENFSELAEFVKKEAIDITLVGPDNPLAKGIVDYFQRKELCIFGPTQRAAQIESSKSFAKKLMVEEGVPTAKFRAFSDYEAAEKYLHKHGAPVVIKASGLALGKGVMVCSTLKEGEEALKKIMVEREFGTAGREVIIEDFLEGREISIHAFCDGNRAVLMPPSQDHKAIFDKNQGPNTGGMGAYAPVPWVTPETLEQVDNIIVKPAAQGLKARGAPFVGCLYPGLIMTNKGPMALEFNARFGDPETQVYMRLLKTDLLDIIWACQEGRLSEINIEWKQGFAVCVIIASGGYPGPYKTGFVVEGIDKAEKLSSDIVVFHAGTKLSGNRIFTAGGRVLGVTAVGSTFQKAVDLAYEALKLIKFKGMQYRKDIGRESLE